MAPGNPDARSWWQLPKWQLVLSFLPLLLVVSQLGYTNSKPLHALAGVILGLVIGGIGVVMNLRLARGSWSGPKLAGAMIGVLILCFIVIVLVGFTLGFLFPAQLGS